MLNFLGYFLTSGKRLSRKPENLSFKLADVGNVTSGNFRPETAQVDGPPPDKFVEPSRERHVRRLAADIAIARAGSGGERHNAKHEAEHCLDVARRIINGEIPS